MARCGWCNKTGLYNGKGADGLETHTLPSSRRACEGPATSSYSSKITSRTPKDNNNNNNK